MPLSEPRGGSGKLALGGPLGAIRPFYPDSNAGGVVQGSDYQYALYSPYENRGVISMNVIDRFVGFETAQDQKPVQFTNAPASGGIPNRPLRINHAAGSGFLWIETTSFTPWIADSMNPATATFSQTNAPPFNTTSVFSLANGQICAVGPTLAGISTSVDGGVTWGGTVAYSINGSADIDHAGTAPIVSPDGSRVAVYSTQGIAIVEDATAGVPGAVAVLATGNQLARGAFNSDGTIFVWTNISPPTFGAVFWSVDPFTVINTVPALNNPFVFDNAIASPGVRDMAWNEQLNGWTFLGQPNTSNMGFMPANNLGIINAGIKVQGETFFQNNGYLESMTIDGEGNYISVGDSMRISSDLVFA